MAIYPLADISAVLKQHQDLRFQVSESPGNTYHFRLSKTVARAFSLFVEQGNDFETVKNIKRELKLANYQDLEEMLKVHLQMLHTFLSINHEDTGAVKRFVSKVPLPFFNAIFTSANKREWNESIQEQIAFYGQTPFVWFVDAEDRDLQSALCKRGFVSLGTFQGIITELTRLELKYSFPEGYEVKRVMDQTLFDRFNQVICGKWKFSSENIQKRNKLYQDAFHEQNSTVMHWAVTTHEQQVVSTLTTIIKNEVVLMMNGTTLPEHREKTLFTNLRLYALRFAVSKGCKIAVGYLNGEAKAKGICEKQGGEVHWKYKPMEYQPTQNRV